MRRGKDARTDAKRRGRQAKRAAQSITRQKQAPGKRAERKRAVDPARTASQRAARGRRKERKHCKRREAEPTADTLWAAVNHWFGVDAFAALRRHGNGRWSVHSLVVVALVWAWTCDPTLTESFHVARATAGGWLGNVYLGETYQGFIRALTACNGILLPVIQRRLRAAMHGKGVRSPLVGGWLAFAVDGSKFEVPWTKDNEAALGQDPKKKKKKKSKAKRRKGKNARQSALRPQLFSTHVWHLGWNLPWAWKHGPVDSSERGHLGDLLDQVPRAALLVADAGFTGYELWKRLVDEQRPFLIRIGSNVRLLEKLGYDYDRRADTVYLWPDRQRQRHQQPPLVLRLIRLDDGCRTMYLATSVLDPKKLSVTQARTIYRKRWSIEGHFRTTKQTYECKKLRSYTAAHARVELDWALVGLWLLGLLAAREVKKRRVAPERVSMTEALKVVRWHLRGNGKPPQHCRRPAGFLQALAQATKDNCKRRSSKTCRHDVRKKREKPPGAPKILKANKDHRAAAKSYAEPLSVQQ